MFVMLLRERLLTSECFCQFFFFFLLNGNGRCALLQVFSASQRYAGTDSSFTQLMIQRSRSLSESSSLRPHLSHYVK